MNDPRGSIWRKWDLHFHTPSSFDYQNKSISNNELIDGLKRAGISVVAITDHHVMDFKRIRELQKLAGKDLTVLPGIELRSELGGKDSVHLVGIFPEDCDPEDVWLHIQAPLKLTPRDIEAHGGDDAVYVSFKEAAALIHEYQGLVSVHAGKKSNSIENIPNNDTYKRVLKKDLVYNSIDILEVKSSQDAKEYKNIVFPEIGKVLPTITCSDNHQISSYTLLFKCWIKSDTTFEGLKQILCEPEHRVFIGENPPKLTVVNNNSTKYIRSIDICKKTDSTLKEEWFHNIQLPLNHDLVAVIGNKGSGKSALVDVIGHVCNSKKHDHFSFLQTQRFRNPQNDLASHFTATVVLESGKSYKQSLDSTPDDNDVETVKYIPQGLFEDVCNEPPGGGESSFDKELKEVIFSHVQVADRLAQDSLDDLIKYKTVETEESIENLKAELHKVNEEIIHLENETTPEYGKQLQNELKQVQEELNALDRARPEEVKRPNNTQAEMQKIAQNIDNSKTDLSDLRVQISKASQKQRNIASQIAIAEKLLKRISNFQDQFVSFQSECTDELSSIGLKFESIVQLQVNTEPLIEQHKTYRNERSCTDQSLDKDKVNSLTHRAELLEKQLSDLQTKLDEPNKRYREYQRAILEWEQRKNAVIGDEGTINTLAYIQKQIKDASMAATELVEVRDKRNNLIKQIYKEIVHLSQEYRKLYEPVQKFIETHPIAKDQLALNFDVSVINTEFHEKFFDWIGHNVVGSFYGQIPGEKVLKRIIDRYDFNLEDGVMNFLADVIDHLTHNKNETNSKKANVRISDQLKRGRPIESFYDYIFSLDYLRPRYVMKMGDKELSQLSPGEKGALLLVFYLLVDKDDLPLIIDQPEENLDNQTVYELLVGSIKEAKQRRQIIIVTHNPNLAVVCDAEQIICASLDKKGLNRLIYMSGAIENPVINRRIVDILEGTKPAFDNRGFKYQPIKPSMGREETKES